ncbi:nitroreductase [Herminiimonas sp. CN]|uniref:nitroreductase family protein n=1 Tax=Herminiimonas sp. CN TaxID=1349818 RepID=UPI0004737735|nr:nitroreductase [Herminiimonas sp. CN]
MSTLPGAATATVTAEDLCEAAQALIHSRQNISPKRLAAPGPTPEQLEQLLGAAAAAPDHGQLHPWRFVIIPADKRTLLAEVFAQALIERDPAATPEQLASAREKAHRAPLLMLAVARLGPMEPDIPALERMVSFGCALQNMLLSAHAMGFGSGLTSGQAMASAPMQKLFALSAGEHPVCFINIGTVSRRKPPPPRPGPWEFTSTL